MHKKQTCWDALSLRKCFLFVLFGTIVIVVLQLSQVRFRGSGVDIQAALVIEDGSVLGRQHLRFIHNLNITPHHKWIVIDVTSGACASDLTAPPGWRIVLTGEVRKTRSCKPPTCISLPLDLPLNLNAGRASTPDGKEGQRRLLLKNLAYLTAISGGADVILDADCMTSLSEAVRILSFRADRDRGLMYNETLLFNPYSHFGAWAGLPRAVGGANGTIDNSRFYYVRDFHRVLVKHGLSDSSKDIVHTGGKTEESSSAAGLRFDPSTPPVFVGQESYSPAVPACSLYRKEALWALLVPCVSRGPRCQLLRHFLQHRLLRELDAFVGFYQIHGRSSEKKDDNAQVKKQGNGHQRSLLSLGRSGKTASVDTAGNTGLKKPTVHLCSMLIGKTKGPGSNENMNAKTLAEVLNAWKCNHTQRFFRCFNDLATFLLKEECIDQHESTLIASWIRVLRDLEVMEPKTVKIPWRGVRKTSEVRVALGNFQARLESGGAAWQQSLRQHLVSSLEKGCNRSDLFPVDTWRNPIAADIALIVVFNSNSYFWPNLPALETLHRPFFRHIFYCVPGLQQLLSIKNSDHQALAKGLSFVEGLSDNWYLFYECVASVVQMNIPGVRGYLHVGDDTLLNTWNMVNASRDTLLNSGGKIRSAEEAKFGGWHWWSSTKGRAPWLTTLASLETLSGLSDQDILSLDPNWTQVSRLSPAQLAILEPSLHRNGTFLHPINTFSATRLKDKAAHSPYRNQLAGSECDSQWTDINPDHTMCQDDVGTEVVLTQETKDALLALHNTLRGQVDPPAANMPKLTWDDDLALVASKWARQCVVGHDSGSKRQVPSLPGVYVGQNGAFGYGSFLTGVESGWWGEVEDFKYGEGSINGGVVGHYTQMATDRSQRIGCGQADCPNNSYRRFYFCNYAVGQFSSDTITPYANGTSCSGCPGHCDDSGSLCECGGLLCLNGGSVQVSTCSCNCPGIWGGDMCEILNCPSADASYCGNWPDNYCDIYSNVPELCPYKCGVCPAATAAPTNAPTDAPTNAPTDAPTNAPTDAPTNAPTDAPTNAPTDASTSAPTDAPTNAPTEHCETSGK